MRRHPGEVRVAAIAMTLVALPTRMVFRRSSRCLDRFLQERVAGSFRLLLQAGITLLRGANLTFARQCTSRVYSIVNGRVGFDGN